VAPTSETTLVVETNDDVTSNVVLVQENMWGDSVDNVSVATMTAVSTTSVSSQLVALEDDDDLDDEREESAGTTTTTITIPPINRQQEHLEHPLYVLPPPTTFNEEEISRREEEFRDMLTYLSHHYIRRDVYALRDPRMRIILEGVASSADDDAIYRAFAILFEDLAPMRWAGRKVFQKCTALLDEGMAARDLQLDRILQTTGWKDMHYNDTRPVDDLRIRFGRVASTVAMDPNCHQEHYQSEVLEHLTHDQLLSIDRFSVLCRTSNNIE
jgi:hypothetical protein